MEKHFLQFLDGDQKVHELQVPVAFEGTSLAGVIQLGDKWVMTWKLSDGTEPMIAMPEDYAPNKGWRIAGYRREG